MGKLYWFFSVEYKYHINLTCSLVMWSLHNSVVFLFLVRMFCFCVYFIFFFSACYGQHFICKGKVVGLRHIFTLLHHVSLQVSLMLCCYRYISTLFAQENFPYITHSQVQSELKDSVTNDWKWNLINFPSYVTSMVAKYKQGQPVSFTDFFGHLLGDVLLKKVSVCVCVFTLL